MTRRAAAFVVLFVLCAGCDATTPSTSTSTAPTTACPETAPTTTVFAGTLGVGESGFYSFSPACATSVRVLLGSLAPTGTNSPSPIAVGLGLGVPTGTGCGLTTSTVASSALASQIVSQVAAGLYCVEIFDVGNIKAPLDYTIRLVY
jgi:hypothetical protein